MLRDAGVRAEVAARDVWRVHPGPIGARTVDVEPDLSNAAPFLAAALVTGGTVTIPGWPASTSQPGDQLRDLLARMGGSCEVSAGGLTVRGGGEIHGLTADLRDVSELAPVLAALAALASSPSRLVGIAHMRSHETDRLAALATQINALGGHVSELRDGIVVTPRPLSAARDSVFSTYDDHRLVMAAAVLGLAVPGLRIENAATVAKTLPEFTKLWTAMLESAP
jgi:3-phosphoshikimate 1-carboxyvinyltransferase